MFKFVLYKMPIGPKIFPDTCIYYGQHYEYYIILMFGNVMINTCHMCEIRLIRYSANNEYVKMSYIYIYIYIYMMNNRYLYMTVRK